MRLRVQVFLMILCLDRPNRQSLFDPKSYREMLTMNYLNLDTKHINLGEMKRKQTD